MNPRCITCDLPQEDDDHVCRTTTCEACQRTFFYDPKHHQCAEGPALMAGESWVEECMRKQREGIQR